MTNRDTTHLKQGEKRTTLNVFATLYASKRFTKMKNRKTKTI